MNFIFSLIQNRNFVLILAVILGLTFGEHAQHIKSLTIYVLALVMAFSMTNIRTSSLYPSKELIVPMIKGALLNYIVYAIITIGLAHLIIDDRELFYGFVIIATTPPGVAIIPFTHILKGDVEYSAKGVLGAFLFTVIITPFAVGWITGNNNINSFDLFILMVKTIVVPLIISRLLIRPWLLTSVNKIRGKIVDWGFATLIFIAIGLNRNVFFSEPVILLKTGSIFLITHFVIGLAFEKIASRYNCDHRRIISQNLLLTIKSSGFAVVTAITIFGQRAAIPTAVLAVFVLMYLLFLSFRQDITKK